MDRGGDRIFDQRYKFILTVETIVKATAADATTNVVHLSSSGVSWDDQNTLQWKHVQRTIVHYQDM